MKTTGRVLLLVLAGMLLGETAWAQHRHGHFYGHAHGHGYRAVAVLPWLLLPPLLYHSSAWAVAPAPVVAAPDVFVERPAGEVPEASPTVNDWYFCRESRAYYPYVRDCAGGWVRVPQRPSVQD